MIRFAATTLMTEHSEYDLLVFHLSCDDHYLSIQRRADLKPGRFGDIRFECDGQTSCGYEVIRRIRFQPGRLLISLDPAKAVKFGDALEYEIELAIAAEDKPGALRFLKRLFAGTELLVAE